MSQILCSLVLEVKKTIINPNFWQSKDIKAINDALLKTISKHKEDSVKARDQATLFDLLDTKTIRSALADFKFDDLSNLMKMVPFKDDNIDISDPDKFMDRQNKLSEVTDTLADLVDDLETDNKNIPTPVKNTVKRYIAEANKGVGTLRPGRLWDLGSMLNTAKLDDDIEYALGNLLHTALGNAVDKHLDLMRDYFAATISRQRSVDAVEATDDATPEKVLTALNDAVKAIKSVDWSGIPAPDQEISEVLAEQVEELDLILTSSRTTSDVKISEGRLLSFWRKAKTTAVTFVRYSMSVLASLGRTVDTLSKLKQLLPKQFGLAIELIVSLFKNIPWM